MANHAYVRTKQEMTEPKISRLLARLNQHYFKGILTIEKSGGCWFISYLDFKHELVGRVCWLDKPKKFEMRHQGSDSSFAWWVDFAITNEVAVKFDGRWSDDGSEGSQKGTPGKYQSFTEFLVRFLASKFRVAKVGAELVRLDKTLTPPAFHGELIAAHQKLCSHDFDEKCSPHCKCEYCCINYAEATANAQD